jgi:hypothetical protein
MNDIEYKKQQRRDINRRAYLKRINGDVKNYSINSDNDNKYIKFLKQKGKIQEKQEQKQESDEESETDYIAEYWEERQAEKTREKTDLNHWLNPDNMRKRDEEFNKEYKPQFRTGFSYLV